MINQLEQMLASAVAKILPEVNDQNYLEVLDNESIFGFWKRLFCK